MTDQLMRWDIINKLIKLKNYVSYKEIGYYKGYSFDNVECAVKTAIDPHPCKTIEMEQAPYGSVINLKGYGEFDTDGGDLECIYKLTSDEYFNNENITTKKAQIFFIDGLHEASQTYRDIINCIKNASEDFKIVLHDLNPPTLEHVTTGDKFGNWNGDSYKAFLQFQAEDVFGNYNCSVVNSDWGVGIIQKASFPLERVYTENYQRGINDWNYFDQNRKELLNLISIEEFLKTF